MCYYIENTWIYFSIERHFSLYSYGTLWNIAYVTKARNVWKTTAVKLVQILPLIGFPGGSNDQYYVESSSMSYRKLEHSFKESPFSLDLWQFMEKFGGCDKFQHKGHSFSVKLGPRTPSVNGFLTVENSISNGIYFLLFADILNWFYMLAFQTAVIS